MLINRSEMMVDNVPAAPPPPAPGGGPPKPFGAGKPPAGRPNGVSPFGAAKSHDNEADEESAGVQKNGVFKSI